jgi:hypothetical protein
VESKYHKVMRGECINSIAKKYGFFWQDIWNHTNNEKLRQKRKNPNVLLEGDEVFIPEIKPKTFSLKTGDSYRFMRKGVPTILRLRLVKLGSPRANLSYTVELDDGTKTSGKTDKEGYLEVAFQPEAKTGKLSIETAQGREEYEIKLGELDPANELSGIQQRLSNLGIPCEITGKLDEFTRAALKKFQEDNKLAITGEPDDATIKKLIIVHGDTESL